MANSIKGRGATPLGSQLPTDIKVSKKFIGEEIIEGKKYFMIEQNLKDKGKVIRGRGLEAVTGSELFGEAVDANQIEWIKMNEISYRIWINKDNYLPFKMQGSHIYTIKLRGRYPQKIEIEFLNKYLNFNKPLDIVLPADAEAESHEIP